MASKQIHYGHNLSPTAQTLEKGKSAAGFYVVSHGITDDFMIGSSPWITSVYNMFNIAGRYSVEKSRGEKFSFQSHYFKSFDHNYLSFSPYKMHTFSQYITYSKRYSPKLNIVYNINGMYFWDETIPFSFRRINATDDKYQMSTTVLVQNQWTETLLGQVELGVLGLNYIHPRYIIGLSGAFSLDDSWLIQLGFMITTTKSAISSTQRYDNNFTLGDSGERAPKQNDKYDISLHPEVQLEYFF